MNNNPISLLFNLTEAMADSLKLAVTKGTILTSDEKANTRIQICSRCPCLAKDSSRCSLCGCFMTVKVRLEASKCPASKW